MLQGRGEALTTIESEGQMLQRACGELMSMKNVIVINDEAHHCYEERPQGSIEELEDAVPRPRPRKTRKLHASGSTASRR
ncbi:hypothetical protein [Croceicoccus ponticola]|uniref:hypothetical protein n=1 Tax=Croceicoccus ponticola TaxID=2217664 RepID=UPI00196A2B33|nr:hypothetical protein [Croceicoccus ponticola]